MAAGCTNNPYADADETPSVATLLDRYQSWLDPADHEYLRLVVNGATAPKYKVTWGTVSKEYTGDQLTKGVNLANDFAVNPFSENFNKIDAAILAKQAYETKQIKSIFHGPEGKKDMEAAVKSTEAERAKLVDAIKPLVVPVTHTIKIEAAQ